MSSIKQINIKNRTYYFFNDINIKTFDPNRIKVDKKSFKKIITYYVGHITIKNHTCAKFNSINLLYFIIDKADGYIEKSNRNKYLTH